MKLFSVGPVRDKAVCTLASRHQTSLAYVLCSSCGGQGSCMSCCCTAMQKVTAADGWWKAMMNESPACARKNHLLNA
jgi:hypothetical protein